MSIDVIGTGLGENGLPPAYARILDAADIIAGGGRMLEMVNGVALRAGRIAISRDIDMFCRDVLKFHEAGKRVVVLADGDPLFQRGEFPCRESRELQE